MPRFDVHRMQEGEGYLIDCQADLLHGLNTRLVVPLLRPGEGPPPISRLNPAFRIRDTDVVMYTQFAASVPVRELGEPVASLMDEDHAIMNAFDMLLTGY
ncbi:CcdB family protein [Sphingosinicella sp. LHD-64]|uniref:CcdB family protein n=1 Tax=Sphingosinicella sp. LHD-64 TaxID=3072139 RepID=UPI00280DFE4D|nr:CcdB family protein [Sphingosinicella sp. LHD-64]MDQ8755046.1 CcdB family protein [Sphingosinicella sp. LHD-64]